MKNIDNVEVPEGLEVGERFVTPEGSFSVWCCCVCDPCPGDDDYWPDYRPIDKRRVNKVETTPRACVAIIQS